MKNEKAIEILDGSICRNSNYCNNDCQCCDVKEALDIGKAAIKKNIPQDVNYLPCWTGEVRYDEAECPSCGQNFEEYEEGWMANYCIACGQALKWKGEDT